MRIGTRRSALALAQAELVATTLGGEGTEAGSVEIVPIVTGGDRGERGADKSRWVAELEQALIDGRIDLAVHSAKDVPGELAPGTALLATTSRAPAEDVLCGAPALEALAAGARVGTSSLRRLAQLRAAREDLEVVPVRGNVDTRLAKLADPAQGLDAIVLARAGLLRLGRDDEAGGTLDPARFVPAPGQGALALQGRADDERTRHAAEGVGDEAALRCLLAERALAVALEADCDTPLGAHAVHSAEGEIALRAWVGLPDGSAWALDELSGDARAPEELGRRVAERLRAAGAEDLLQRAREMADGR
ncbi:MAG TPA: hydroxymethylbilane synthase [Solirubrobacteraceae bacterium]|nr:hydroxymethylbilane synthase [Solirubrobacteraceae bacterium]